MSTRLESFFLKARPKIDLARKLTGEVREGPVGPLAKRFTVSDDGIANLPIAINGQLSASARIFPLDHAVSVLEFDDPAAPGPAQPAASRPVLPGAESVPETAKPPRSHAYSELVLVIGAGAAAAVRPPTNQALTVAAEAAASGGLRYRLLLPAPSTAMRAAAIGNLLVTARPLQRLDLRQIAPGELHAFDARFQLGFDLKTQMGQEFDFSQVIDLFDDTSATLQAHAEATVSASLGWSLYERMQIAVGKVNLGVDDPEWVRLRLQRHRRRQLTLGAKLAVQTRYDLGKKTFQSLLDRILEVDPLPRLFAGLDQLEELGLHRAGTPAEWEAIRARLTDELAELIVDYVDPTSRIAELPWEKVEPLVEDLGRLVEGYRQLDEKAQSLVEAILGRVGLETGSSLRAALEQIADLDPRDLDSVIARIAGPDFTRAIDLLELLSGWSVEDLVVGSGAARPIQEAAALAAQIQAFLDHLGDKAIVHLESFTRNSGVEGVMAWLEANAASTEDLRRALEHKATATIRSLVERVAETAWDRLDADDLERLRRWSERLIELGRTRQVIDAKVRAAMERLDGEAGFSVGIEIGRLSERAAILDLEIDPRNARVRRIAESTLARLTARELLEQLPEPREDDEDEDLGYRLRDSVFSYRRIRSSSLSTFFSLMGIQRARQTVRVDEEVVRLRPETDRQRQVTYSTGAVRRITDHGRDALAGGHELGVWLTQRLAGAGLDLNAPYDLVTDGGLQIVYCRKDNKTHPEEIGALNDLLVDIGFRNVVSGSITDIVGGSDPLLTELSFKIELGAEASRAILKNKTTSNWDRDYLNAAHRWLDDRLVPRRARAVGRPQPHEGELLARLLEHPKFQAGWKRGLDLYREDTGEPWHARLGGRVYRVPITFAGGQGRYNALTAVLMHRLRSTKKLSETVDQYKLALRTLEPDDLRKFGKKFATLLARTPFGGWPTPLFNLWLVLARLAREDASLLDQARGLATLRFRATLDQPWGDPVRWELRGGHPGSEIFPF